MKSQYQGFEVLALLGVVSLFSLACSLNSTPSVAQQGGGMGFSGVQSTVNSVVGTPEEREARRCAPEAARKEGYKDSSKGRTPDPSTYQTRCSEQYRADALAAYDEGFAEGQKIHLAELCRADKARKQGLRHGRWGMAFNASEYAQCEADMVADLEASYNEGYQQGRSELEQNRRYFAEQEEACDENAAYELGYEHGMDGDSMNSSSINKCDDLLAKDDAQAAYKRGYYDGIDRQEQIERRAKNDDFQARVCDAEAAFSAGVKHGELHYAVNISNIEQCEDESLRWEALVSYELGYNKGYGFAKQEQERDRTRELQRRYYDLRGDQLKYCNINNALDLGYEDGYYGDAKNKDIIKRCKDSMLRDEALTRYEYGYAQGDAQYLLEKEYKNASDYQKNRACDRDLAYEMGESDALSYLGFDSSWIQACRDEDLQYEAMQAYKRGYYDAVDRM